MLNRKNKFYTIGTKYIMCKFKLITIFCIYLPLNNYKTMQTHSIICGNFVDYFQSRTF